jgi:hypothetical protein
MTVSMPNDERLLPAPEQLEIADYLMGSYLSELESIASRVKRETDNLVDYDEHLAAKAAGVTLGGPELERGELLELLRFATDAVHDADTIREQAVAMQTSVLAQLHENGPMSPEAWRAYRGRVRAYHGKWLAAYADDDGTTP